MAEKQRPWKQGTRGKIADSHTLKKRTFRYQKGNVMAKLKKIGVMFSAKLQAVVMGIAGLIAGILYSIGGLLYDLITTGSVNTGTALAFLALIGMPLLFSAFGVIIGLVEAIIYNQYARRFGGIEPDFE